MLHLALGHHLDDQAETLLLRLGRGSGLEGLAAMAPIAELPGLRLLRPLLEVPKARLEATLAARGLSWIEDPTNRDPSHARVRLRRLMPALAREGLTPARLAATAENLARARAALDLAVARVLVRAVALYPAGFATFDPAPLLAAPPEVGLRALARVLMAVGGAAYTPRLERLRRLYGRLGGGLPEVPVRPGERLHWDGRFEVAVRPGARARRGGLSLGPLGAAGWAEVGASAPDSAATAIPAAARPALPVLSDGAGLVAVPHLGYRSTDWPQSALKSCRFRPKSGLTGPAFTVA